MSAGREAAIRLTPYERVLMAELDAAREREQMLKRLLSEAREREQTLRGALAKIGQEGRLGASGGHLSYLARAALDATGGQE